MKPCKPWSSKKPGKLELHAAFACANQVAFDLQLCAKLHGFLGRSWSSAPGLNQMRMVGHIEVIPFLVTFGAPIQEKKRHVLKKREKSHEKNKTITSMIHFSVFFQAECQRTCESRRPHLQSSWVVQGFITFSTESLHRHEVFATSFSAFKTHQEVAKCWFLWFLSTKFTIKTYRLGGCLKVQKCCTTVQVKCWTNDHLWGHFRLQCFHGFVWHGHPGGHAKCSWSKTAAPRPCQSKSWDVTTSRGKSSNYDL